MVNLDIIPYCNYQRVTRQPIVCVASGIVKLEGRMYYLQNKKYTQFDWLMKAKYIAYSKMPYLHNLFGWGGRQQRKKGSYLFLVLMINVIVQPLQNMLRSSLFLTFFEY